MKNKWTVVLTVAGGSQHSHWTAETREGARREARALRLSVPHLKLNLRVAKNWQRVLELKG